MTSRQPSAVSRQLNEPAALPSTDSAEALLNELLRVFFEKNPDWLIIGGVDGGGGLCDEASGLFSRFCATQEVDAVPRWMSLSGPRFEGCNGQPAIKKPHPAYPVFERRHFGEDHCVAVVEGRWAVDLTARQYGDELPFPFLWELASSDQVVPSPLRPGDRVRATCIINGAALRGDEGVVLKIFPGRQAGLVDFEARRFWASAEATVIFGEEVEEVRGSRFAVRGGSADELSPPKGA